MTETLILYNTESALLTYPSIWMYWEEHTRTPNANVPSALPTNSTFLCSIHSAKSLLSNLLLPLLPSHSKQWNCLFLQRKIEVISEELPWILLTCMIHHISTHPLLFFCHSRKGPFLLLMAANAQSSLLSSPRTITSSRILFLSCILNVKWG